MGRLSHSRTLALWMNGTYVGTWQLHPQQGDVLNYADSWITAAEGRPLSLSLPFTPGNEPHRGTAVHAYFENLLPDSRDIRERIARRFGATTTDAFALLAQIGRDCVGALQILPPGVDPTGISDIDAELLTEADVARILRETVSPSAFGGSFEERDELRISIAGAQEKTALLQIDGQWHRPRNATPTSHIFKLDLRESVENEWLCSLILKAYGLPVAHSTPMVFEDQKVLCVERFDRIRWTDGDRRRIIRLPQEDMCQATATPPHLKYEADGGPGIDQIIRLLDGSIQRDADRLMFFRAQVLFWMLCAPDGHAKNFSLALRPNGAYQLTPLYDVMSAYPVLGEGPNKISPHRVKLAMAIRSKNPHWRVKDIQRRHWLMLGRRYGILAQDGRDVGGVLDDLVAQTPEVIEQIQSAVPSDFPMSLAEGILGGLRDASERLGG